MSLVGDVGLPTPDAPSLVASIRRRLQGVPAAPVVVLGDVFYRDGLLGLCREGSESVRSLRGCRDATTPEQQMDRVFSVWRDGLAGRPVIGIAGNHDHHGDPEATRNACRLFPAFAPDWAYLARGCGLSDAEPVRVVDAGAVILFLVDSEEMIRDSAFRRASVEALRAEIERARRERPRAWRVLAMHHPLESHGLHNGAHPLTALRKDLYWLSWTALLPVSLVLDRTLLAIPGQQDLYQGRYRAFRGALYRMLRDAPVDLVVAGHDHSVQIVGIDHPGVGTQLVSGAGAYRTPVKRYGLDLGFTNRLARAIGLRDRLPAPRHRLLFGASLREGLAHAVLVPDGDRLVVEIYGTGSDEPMVAYPIERAPVPQEPS